MACIILYICPHCQGGNYHFRLGLKIANLPFSAEFKKRESTTLGEAGSGTWGYSASIGMRTVGRPMERSSAFFFSQASSMLPPSLVEVMAVVLDT